MFIWSGVAALCISERHGVIAWYGDNSLMEMVHRSGLCTSLSLSMRNVCRCGQIWVVATCCESKCAGESTRASRSAWRECLNGWIDLWYLRARCPRGFHTYCLPQPTWQVDLIQLNASGTISSSCMVRAVIPVARQPGSAWNCERAFLNYTANRHEDDSLAWWDDLRKSFASIASTSSDGSAYFRFCHAESKDSA